jgi:signal transduction histidine kinase
MDALIPVKVRRWAMRGFPELMVNAPVLITVQRGTGMDLHLELLNPFAREALGGRDMQGKTLREAFPELERWLLKVDTSVLKGRPYVGVDEPFTLDWSGRGKIETRYLTLICQPLLGLHGTIEGSLLLAIDVTANVLARTLHPRDRAWFEAALDAIGLPVVLVDPETRRAFFSNAAARMLSREGPPSGTVFGQVDGIDPGFFCTDSQGSPIADEALPDARAARGEIVDAMDVVWHTPFGVFPLTCFAEAVPATEGLPATVIVSFFDVSEAKRLECKLLEGGALQDDFMNLVGHELRTPLAALKLQTQSLLTRDPHSPGLAAIARATARMETLAEQMLDCVRIRQLGVHLHPEELNLVAAVDEAISGCRMEASRFGSTVERVGAPEVRGIWDRAKLMQIITHLLSNALRFGRGQPVRIECRDLGDRAGLVVSDHGIGIDPGDHERVFERYGRAVSSRNYGGLGLGLWITREIVRTMGGSIAVVSARDQGATFTVELPKTPPVREHASSKAHRVEPRSAT